MKEIYIVKTQGYVGMYLPSKKCPHISYTSQKNFIDFIKSIMEDYPNYKLRCIINKGIEDKISKKIIEDKMVTYPNRQRE